MTIHVLCLNPALDKVFAIDGFAAGEDYPGQRPEAHIGGKGFNVARVLCQLGERVHLYAFLGEENAGAFRRDMEPRCACSFVEVPGACRTTINIVDRQGGRETVITEAGPSVGVRETALLLDALAAHAQPGDIVCCSGSIIDGADKRLYAQIARLCETAQMRCTLDCNAATLTPSLEGARYALGKPNERELCALLGEERTCDPQRLAALARRAMPPYEALLVSMGAAGGIYVDAAGAWRAEAPKTPVVSTVGSGDASFAGALSAMARGLSAPEGLRLAMACGVNNAARGGNGSVDAREVAALAACIEATPLEKAQN